jgi:crotonobetainyl-CoA:carnitine CoA-transferase CaiB-like acyl-CoA transferase
MKKQILEGLRIVEFGHFIAAPLTGMMLAEQGADVIHIVNPNELESDPILNAILERGKTRLFLDLKNSQDLVKFKDLISKSDCLINNYSPETLPNFGVDIDNIRSTINPQLIYCSIPAFPGGDLREKIPGYEAIAGMAGLIYEKPLSNPIQHDFPLGSVMSGIYAAIGIIGALIVRKKEGIGQNIEVSLYQSNLFAMMLQILVLTGAPRSFMPLKMLSTPFMGAWECADKRQIYVHMTMPAHNAKIIEFLDTHGFHNEIDKLRSILSPITIKDPTLISSIGEANKIRDVMKGIFLSKPALEWESLLGEEFCVIKIRTLHEWVEESVQSKIGDCIKVPDPIFGELYAPGPVVVSNPISAQIKPRILNRKYEEIIELWNASAIPYDSSKKSKIKSQSVLSAPLEGIRVFDLSRIIAGPFAARILTELGADVISITSPNNLEWALSFHAVYNVGKKSVNIDLASEEGAQQLWSLIETLKPNVFIQNYRSLALTKQFGLDFEKLQKKLPNIVYTHMNAYGNVGEWQTRAAFEQVVQAVTGIQLEYMKGSFPKVFPVAILDTCAGLLGGFGSILGLYHQIMTGESVFVHSNMVTASMLIQIIGFSQFQQQNQNMVLQQTSINKHFDIINKINAYILRTANIFCCLAGPVRSLHAWLSSLQLIKGSIDKFDVEIKNLHNEFRKKPFSYWKDCLDKSLYATKIGLIPRFHINHLFKDVQSNNPKRSSIVSKKNYPGLKNLSFVQTPILYSKTPILDVSAAPIRGQDTKSVLSLIGKDVPEGTGIIGYPPDKPFIVWLWNFLKWGIYGLRSGRF